jgi:hypothetical protein
MRRLIMAAALAAAASSFALAPVMADNAPVVTSTSPDAAGVDDLGIDISSVTLTPTGVHAFISSLAPDARRGVEAACSNYARNSAGVGEQTLAFCADAMKAA